MSGQTSLRCASPGDAPGRSRRQLAPSAHHDSAVGDRRRAAPRPPHRRRRRRRPSIVGALAASTRTSTLEPYVLSFRPSRPAADARLAATRPPLAIRLWSRRRHRALDRWLGRRRRRPRHELRRAADAAAVPSCRSTTAGSSTTPTRPSPTCAAPATVLRRRRAPGRTSCTLVGRHGRTRSASCSATERVATIHLGPPPAARRSRPTTDRPACRRSTADRSSSPSARSSGARTCPTLVAAFGASPPSTATCALVIAGADGDDSRRRRRRRSTRSTPTPPRAACCGSGRSTTATKAWLLHHARGARLPVARRGLRLPDARGPAARHAGGRQRRRLDPRDRRRRRALLGDRDRRRRARRRPRTGVVDERRHAAELDPSPAARNVPGSTGTDTADAPRSTCTAADDSRARDDDGRRSRSLSGGVGAARFLAACIDAVDARRRSRPSSTPATTRELHGLSISPDLDTITYTLAGAIDPERGWGLAGETWRAMDCARPLRAVRPAGSSAATDVVQPRRPRPRHPPLPHGPARRGGLADRRSPTRSAAPGASPIALAADDRRPHRHDRRARRTRRDLVPGLLRAPAPRRRRRRGPLRRRGAALSPAPDRRSSRPT